MTDDQPQPTDLNAPFDLSRALAAIERTQSRWLNDIRSCCHGEPRFLDAFRRWEEQLTLLKLQVHRAEQHLLHYLLVPEDLRPWNDLPGQVLDRKHCWAKWNDRLLPWMQSLHIDTFYRRIPAVLDDQSVAVSADIITDFVAICEVAESTNTAMKRFLSLRNHDHLESLAFYHVLSPWKQHGMPALLDCLRFLYEFLNTHDEL